ncbi:aminotransferase class IV [Cellulomonas sp. URHD0024]|uniref:aminotransferase class IV n=1 Tax=Cellulomonas sp. URHD0024 TaxID=1302620 RepID=UPI001E6359E5|nr:aminotransferase class IV [Cellulomonas sp. URHD0024]
MAGLALCNYGHFTTMLMSQGRVRGLSLHLQRLVRDCRKLLDAELDVDRVRALVRRVDSEVPQTVRVTVYAPQLQLARPGADLDAHVLVTTRPAPGGELPPLRLRSVAHRRDVPDVKHVGLFEAVRQRRLAQRAGFDDALFVDDRSRVLEGTTWNIGFHDGAELVWPSGEQLLGVTMHLVQSLGVVTSVTRELDLRAAAGFPVAFATSAAVGVRPIAALDDTPYDTATGLLDEVCHRYLTLPGDEV